MSNGCQATWERDSVRELEGRRPTSCLSHSVPPCYLGTPLPALPLMDIRLMTSGTRTSPAASLRSQTAQLPNTGRGPYQRRELPGMRGNAQVPGPALASVPLGLGSWISQDERGHAAIISRIPPISVTQHSAPTHPRQSQKLQGHGPL